VARIARLRRLRQEAISETLPDFLDVLAVTVSAGVGFRSALGTVSDRFGGPLGDEVTLALNQIRNGSSVREAFHKLRARNDSEALSQFVGAYMQSEDLGAPLAQTLTRISEDTRRASAQAQRQKAARVAPRVTLVTSMVLVPGALVLLFTGFVLGSGVDFAGIAESLS
jgi:tight adherence protein C